MNGTLDEFLSVLRRNLGFVEGPNNDNPYAKVCGHANHQAWCASFACACAITAGVKLPGTSAYTPALYQSFYDAGRAGHAPRVGAFVFFQWPGMDRIAHVGVVERVLGPNNIWTIEGNTDVRGGRTGGRVMRQHRQANIAGYGYPVFATPGALPNHKHAMPEIRLGSTGDAVVDLQGHLNAWRKNRRLSQHTGPKGEFDTWTHEALRTFQGTYGLNKDGVCGSGTWPVVHGITKGARA